MTSGRLKALAVTSLHPSPLAPGLPTVAATGLPGYEITDAHSILAPARTPAAVVNRLNREIVRAIKSAPVKQKFLSIGVEVVGSSPAELAASVKHETAKWAKVFKDAGIRGE